MSAVHARRSPQLQSLVTERAPYLFPPNLVGRGWPWGTGVPVALDAFEAGDFLTAAAELDFVSLPAEFGPRGFHRVLLGISLHYAGEYEDAGRRFRSHRRPADGSNLCAPAGRHAKLRRIRAHEKA